MGNMQRLPVESPETVHAEQVLGPLWFPNVGDLRWRRERCRVCGNGGTKRNQTAREEKEEWDTPSLLVSPYVMEDRPIASLGVYPQLYFLDATGSFCGPSVLAFLRYHAPAVSFLKVPEEALFYGDFVGRLHQAAPHLETLQLVLSPTSLPWTLSTLPLSCRAENIRVVFLETSTAPEELLPHLRQIFPALQAVGKSHM